MFFNGYIQCSMLFVKELCHAISSNSVTHKLVLKQIKNKKQVLRSCSEVRMVKIRQDLNGL